jgi:hypothetical protein
MTEKLTEADFDEVDREALSRSLQVILDGDDKSRAEQVRDFLNDEEHCGWFYATSFCSSICQSRALGLKPWQSAPSDADEDDPHGQRSEAVRLLSPP